MARKKIDLTQPPPEINADPPPKEFLLILVYEYQEDHITGQVIKRKWMRKFKDLSALTSFLADLRVKGLLDSIGMNDKVYVLPHMIRGIVISEV